MKIEVELHLNQSDSLQWYTKVTDLLAYATDLGFKDIKMKPEGYSTMEYGVDATKWERPQTDEERQKLLKELERYKKSKTNGSE